MRRVWIVQHVSCEAPGTLGEVLAERGIATEIFRPFEGDSLPRKIEGADGLILLGGPMGVYEERQYPFLREERRLIEAGLKKEKPILGICLGSQLLATVLGAAVTRGKEKEIGWHSVYLSEAARSDPLLKGMDPSFVAYHWHGDIFDLPPGAVLLASSDRTACQAFRYGDQTYGLLFHMETTRPIIEGMVHAFPEELAQANTDGREILRQAEICLAPLREKGRAFFEKWAMR